MATADQRREHAEQVEADAALAEVRRHARATRIEDAVKGRRAARDVIREKGKK